MSFFFNVPKGQQRPADAVEIMPSDLMEFYDRVIKGWKPQMQIWALSKGKQILSTAAGVGGIYILSIYRKKLRLGHFGQATSYLPMAGFAILLTNVYHHVRAAGKVTFKRLK